LENFRERLYRFVYLFYTHSRFTAIVHGKLVMVQQEFIWSAVENCFLLCLSPVIIDKNVSHDREQPCFDIGTYAVFFFIGKSLIQGFLVQVIGSFGITRKVDREWLQK